MPLDTKIEGNPEDVRGAAHWLRSSMAAGVTEGASQIYAARNHADGGWHDGAATGFRNKMTKGAQKADDLAAAANGAAGHFDNYAADMQRAQDDMRRVRENAAKAGLSVDGDLIHEPGPAPVVPGPAPSGDAATPAAIKAHADATTASNTHAAQVQAWEAAQHAASATRTTWKIASDTLKNVWDEVTQKWFFTAGDLLGGAAETTAVARSSQLLKHSKFLTGEATKFLEAAKNSPPGTTAASVYRDVDTAKALGNSADDVAKSAKNLERGAGKLVSRAGGALAVAGVAYDIIANDKPVGQAVVSGAVGFGASVAAGAAIGTLIPVPVVGTAVGAVGGAIVGVFASGAVDSLYQNGVGAVGQAAEDGVKAIGDTGQAIGNLAEGAWGAIF